MSDPGQMPIGRSVGRAHKFVRAWGDRCLAPLDATVTDWILLSHADSAPAPGLSQSEVARFADMGGPALVRHLDRLEEDSILVRTRDTEDRRVVRVTVTDKGRSRLEELRTVMDDCDAQLRAQLTAQEQQVLQRACDRIFEFAYGQLQEEET
jgi:MarR family transcriptional regulator for hemolysin